MSYLYTRHFSKQLYIMLVPIPFNHKNLSVTSVNIVNPLVLELSAQCTVENTRDLNNYILLLSFSTNGLNISIHTVSMPPHPFTHWKFKHTI